MSQCPQFNLFDYSVMSNKRSEYIILTANSKFGHLIYLKKAFFQESISSTITSSSKLHDIFCSNCNSLVINMARENIPLHSVAEETTNNVHDFLTVMTQQYQPSSTIYRILSSCTYSLFTFHRLSGDDNYVTLGWIAYICDPLVGLLILFVIVKEEFRNKGIGTAMIQTLQLFVHKNIGTKKTLVWFTKVSSSSSNSLVKYYRNLGFHVTIPMNHALNHELPSSLVFELNQVSNNAYNEEREFILETTNDIQKPQMEVVVDSDRLSSDPNTKCENCSIVLGRDNVNQRNFVLCEHVLKGSLRVNKTGSKKKSICGMILCYQCQSYFGCDQIDYCPLHHRTKSMSHQQHNAWLKKTRDYKICSVALNMNVYEKIPPKNKAMMSFCRHCSLLKEAKYTKNPNYVYFNTLHLSSHKFLKYIYNNAYDIRHMQWMIENGLHKEHICPFSGEMKLKHPKVFRSNSGKPCSILLNTLFSIRQTEGHGDCGVLCLLYSFCSADESIRTEIHSACQNYMRNHWLSKYTSNKSIDISSIIGLRELLMYAKTDNTDSMPCLARIFNESSYAIIEDASKKKGKGKKKQVKTATDVFHGNLQMAYNDLTERTSDETSKKKEIEEVLQHFKTIFTSTSYDNDADNVYWLQDIDFFNVSVFTNGLVGALCVKDEDDPSKNDFSDFVHDFGYKTYFEKPILKEAKYFFIVRYVGSQHYDLLHDAMRNISLFSTEEMDNPTSAVSVLLNLLSTKRRMELSGVSPNMTWDEIYGLTTSNTIHYIPNEFFTLNVPSWETWYDKCISSEHDLFKEVKRIFPWTQFRLNEMKAMQGLLNDEENIATNLSMPELDHNFIIRLVKKNSNKYIKVILNVKEFDKENDIQYVGYILVEGEKSKITFFDINGIEILMNRFHKLTGTKGIDCWDDHFKSGNWRIADVMDMNKIQQKLAWMIFSVQVHSAGKFDFRLRREIGMNIGDEFNACVTEKFRLMTQLTDDPLMKKRFAFAYMFGKYSDKITKRLFLFLNDDNDVEVIDEYKYRSVRNLHRKVKERNIFNFILISTYDLLFEMKALENSRARKKFEFAEKLLTSLRKLMSKQSVYSHYFTFTNFIRNHDFEFLYQPVQKDDEWVKLLGFFCCEKMFEKWIINNKNMSQHDRFSLQNLSIVMREHCGYCIEPHLQNLQKALDSWKDNEEKNIPEPDYWKLDVTYNDNITLDMKLSHINEKHLRTKLIENETSTPKTDNSKRNDDDNKEGRQNSNCNEKNNAGKSTSTEKVAGKENKPTNLNEKNDKIELHKSNESKRGKEIENKRKESNQAQVYKKTNEEKKRRVTTDENESPLPTQLEEQIVHNDEEDRHKESSKAQLNTETNEEKDKIEVKKKTENKASQENLSLSKNRHLIDEEKQSHLQHQVEVESVMGLLSLKKSGKENVVHDSKTKHVITGTVVEYLAREIKHNEIFSLKRQAGKPAFFQPYQEVGQFQYNASTYKIPNTFVDYDTWQKQITKEQQKKKADEDICLQSISLGYKLSYVEVYGRLLGNDELVTNRRYKELNDTIINAVIKQLSYQCIKTISSTTTYPRVYIATTYLHRYFERKTMDLKNAMLCFYQISRGEDRRENPQFFYTNKIFLIPWNVNNVHWVLLFVDMIGKEIMVVDSCSSDTLSTAIRHKMNLVVKFLCTLCNYEHREDDDWHNMVIRDFHWIEENGWLPKQDNSYDCGVFMLMNIFVSLHEMGVLYTQKDTNTFRNFFFRIMLNMMHEDEEEMKRYQAQIVQSSQQLNEEIGGNHDSDNDENLTNRNINATTLYDDGKGIKNDSKLEQNVQLSITDGTDDINGSLVEEEDFGLPDVEGKFSDLGIKNQMQRTFRKPRTEEEDYNVENLKKDLASLSVLRQLKYIMALKEKGQWNYYLATDKTKHPRRKSGRGVLFNLLREEFVKTRLYAIRALDEFVITLQQNKGNWMDMSTEFKNVYEMELAEDRHTIIRKHGTYQRLRIVQEKKGKKEKIYGIVMMDKKELLADKLTYQDLRNRHLKNEVEALRNTKRDNSWIALSHGKSSESIEVNYKKEWPNVAFVQGKYNTCLQRSIASVLIYIRTSRKLQNNTINEVILGLHNLSINKEAKISKGKIAEVCVFMRQKGFFIQKLEPKKRKHNGRIESINVLASNMDFGLFSLIQICGNDYDSNHTVVICDGWIFDSNHPKAMPLGLKYLNICCSNRMKSILYDSCTLMYKFQNKKILKNKPKLK